MDSWLCLRKFYTGPNISRRMPGRRGSRGATHDGVVKTHHIRRTENIAALSPIPGLLRVVHTDDPVLSVNWQILLSSALASLCLFAWREAGKDNSFVIKVFQTFDDNSPSRIRTLIMEKRSFNDMLFENGPQSSTCSPDPSHPSRSNENYEPAHSDASRE